jgi:transcriptional regulator with XRE-family HTH domain
MAAIPPPIGLKIKRARERLLMTQAELGTRVRKSQKTIDNWEHNRSYPKSSIGALEDVLGVSLSEPAPEQEVPPDMMAAIRREVPPEDQERVIEAVRRELNPPREYGAADGSAPRHEAG